jgi:hypothetical protein
MAAAGVGLTTVAAPAARKTAMTNIVFRMIFSSSSA